MHNHQKRDRYLSLYNGFILSSENVSVQSEFTYRPNNEIFFEINDSLASFNLLQIARMTSKNLFKIRHPCFTIYRNMQFKESLNNFTQFCLFFNIDENKRLEKPTKSRFAEVEKLEEEMEITQHTFYEETYGKKVTILYDQNLKYY